MNGQMKTETLALSTDINGEAGHQKMEGPSIKFHKLFIKLKQIQIQEG